MMRLIVERKPRLKLSYSGKLLITNRVCVYIFSSFVWAYPSTPRAHPRAAQSRRLTTHRAPRVGAGHQPWYWYRTPDTMTHCRLPATQKMKMKRQKLKAEVTVSIEQPEPFWHRARACCSGLCVCVRVRQRLGNGGLKRIKRASSHDVLQCTVC